jgi:hypothetical protein
LFFLFYKIDLLIFEQLAIFGCLLFIFFICLFILYLFLQLRQRASLATSVHFFLSWAPLVSSLRRRPNDVKRSQLSKVGGAEEEERCMTEGAKGPKEADEEKPNEHMKKKIIFD